MTVAQLIDTLQKMPQHAPVVLVLYGSGKHVEVKTVISQGNYVELDS